MYNFFKYLVILSLLAYGSFGFSKTLTFKSFYYPTASDVDQLKAHDSDINLEVCCYYPSLSDYIQLNKLNIRSLKITAGTFPTSYEMKILDRLIGTKVIIEVSEVFPGSIDHQIINKSNIEELIINSYDFPTSDEVQAYNGFKKHVRLNILRRKYPLPKHMKHIKKLKKEFTVGFFNRIPPGIGYANFFNDLKTNKVFVIVEKFPYGTDYEGINLLTKSKIEIRANERLMPQDVEQINKIKIDSLVVLKDQYPLTDEFFQRMLSITDKKVELEDNGSGDLLNEEYDQFYSRAQNEVNLRFPLFL